MQSDITERLRLKEPSLRLGLRAHTEGLVLERFPISQTLNIRFDGGRVGMVREDQLEPIPPKPAEEPKSAEEIAEDERDRECAKALDAA